jgi:integrase
MPAASRLPTGSLVVRTGPTGTPFYEAKWRHGGRQTLRRVGPAWLDPDGEGWKPRRGRAPEGTYDEKRATVRMAAMIAEHAEDMERKAREDQAERDRLPTFREVGAAWLEWLETRERRKVKPSTLRDYRYMLAEPGTPHARGKGTYEGRIIRAFGDLDAAAITTRGVSRFLRSLDQAGVSPRNVNKHRQVLASIFTYAMREDSFALAANPVVGTDKRDEAPAAALDFYEPEEVEALARAAAEGRHRKPAVGRGGKPVTFSPEEVAARCAEDAQDAEMFRVLAFTGMRVGEALALEWGDVDLEGRRVIVQRAVSATVVGTTKSGQWRYLPLADPAHDALERLKARGDFTQREDYVFCGRVGGRLDSASVRRRYHAARRAAGLRYVKLHGLRHGAGSLAARYMDPVSVQHFLGHSKLATTERYMHAKARPEDVDRLNQAFGVKAREREQA